MPLLLLLLLFAAAENYGAAYPGKTWDRTSPSDAGLDETKLREALDYALSAEGSGYVIRRGKLVYEWGDLHQLYDLKSTSKSIGVTALGLALKDGKVRLDDPAIHHHPSFGVPPESNKETGWIEKITLRQL